MPPTQHEAIPAYAIGHLRSVQATDSIIEYINQIDSTLAPFGGSFLVHGGAPSVVEGTWTGDLCIIAFPDRAHAEGWYRSAAYQRIVQLRTESSEGEILIVDGVAAGYQATDILRSAIPTR